MREFIEVCLSLTKVMKYSKANGACFANPYRFLAQNEYKTGSVSIWVKCSDHPEGFIYFSTIEFNL